MKRERREAEAWKSVRLMSVALVIGALAGAINCDSAAAVSITNRDERDHKITLIEGDKKSDNVLKSEAVMADVCMKGCVVRLNDSENDEYELEGTEVVSIEDGYLYYDGPDASTEPMAAEVPKDPKAAAPPGPAAPPKSPAKEPPKAPTAPLVPPKG